MAASTASPTTLTATSAGAGLADATNANSGNTQAVAGNVGNSDTNLQTGVAVAGGGAGAVGVANSSTLNVADAGGAQAGSGMAVALSPTAVAGATSTAGGGPVVADSGAAMANGVSAQNNVTNQANAVARVGAANQATVTVSSSNTVNITNQGQANAQSGDAWAVNGGSVPSMALTQTVAAGSSPTSSAVSATALANQAGVSNANAANLTTGAGSPSNTTALNVGQSETVTGTSAGTATVTSGAACGAVACAAAGSGAGTTVAAAGSTAAVSGSAQAQGVIANNTVNTNAQARVQVAGQNFSPIQIVINSVTNIVNAGSASAGTGSAIAGGGSTSTSGAGGNASSGNIQVTGADVNNQINLSSSAAVHVAGDNYNPINVVLNFIVSLVNQGSADGQSGDAQSGQNGSGNASAQSGSVNALGLRAINLVNLWASASVDIDGNNYAPIYVYIGFDTTIYNVGTARAMSGNVRAGTPSTNSGSSGGSNNGSSKGSNGASGGSFSGGSAKVQSGAMSGNATAMSHRLSLSTTAVQLGDANGSGVLNAFAQMAPQAGLPPLPPSPLLAGLPPLQPGVLAVTGNSLATGINDSTNVLSVQTAVCESPEQPCQASNSLAEHVTQKDIKAAPPASGSGSKGTAGTTCVGVCASSGSAYANATPTPLPTPEDGSYLTYYTIWYYYTYWNYGFGGGGGGGGAAQPTEYLPWGHYVLVDMWGRDPSRRLPPMPGQSRVKSPSRIVTLEDTPDGWPGVDALPLPDLVPAETDVTEAAPSPVPAAGRTAGAAAAPVTAAAPAAAATDTPPPDGTIVDLDLWGADRDVANLPQPEQAARQAAAPAVLAINPDSLAVPIAPAAASGGTASGPPTVQYVLGALGALLAALGGMASATQRGRFWMSSRRAAAAGLLASARAALAGLGSGGRARLRVGRAWFATQGIRTLAILRLTIGLFGLRLW
ncbi:MAG: hypothetical protein JO023_15005 [Chloroflexi bacterium]|nr:hypothetical protein [Chloroflexota bacterium]